MIKRILVLSNSAIVTTHFNQLCIKTEDKEESVPIEDIGVVLLENHQTTITNSVLNKLTENNSVLITCNQKHLPSGMLLPISGNVLHTEILRKQIKTKKPLSKKLWQQIIKAKILNQYLALKNIKSNCEPLLYFYKNVKSGDTTNKEARSAIFYWSNIFPFEKGFKRDIEQDGINSFLNYGYSIIRGVVARAIVSSGLHPAIGIFHRNQYNPFCLADDLMEPFRPFVDLNVYRYFLNPKNQNILNTEAKKYLISVLFQDSFFLKERKPIQLAITKSVQGFVKCISGESKKIFYPTLDEI